MLNNVNFIYKIYREKKQSKRIKRHDDEIIIFNSQKDQQEGGIEQEFPFFYARKNIFASYTFQAHSLPFVFFIKRGNTHLSWQTLLQLPLLSQSSLSLSPSSLLSSNLGRLILICFVCCLFFLKSSSL